MGHSSGSISRVARDRACRPLRGLQAIAAAARFGLQPLEAQVLAALHGPRLLCMGGSCVLFVGSVA